MFSESQFKALALAPKITSILSLFGTVYIIRDVLTSQKKRRLVYHHILVSLSLCDLIIDVTMFMSTWPIPADTPLIYGAVGTQATCTAQGYFLQLAIMAPMYNAVLSLYYLLMVKYNWSERRLRKLRIPVHCIILTFGLSTSIAGLPLTLYNNANLWCWIAPLPPGCKESLKNNGETDCIRGDNATAVYRWAFFYAPLWGAICFATFAMFQVWWTVRTDRRAESYLASSMTSSQGRKLAIRMERRTRSGYVATQAAFYLGAFYLTWVWSTAIRIQQSVSPDKRSFPILLLTAIFLPFQGFFNFLVYIRPRYQRYRRENSGNMSVLGAMRRISSSAFRRASVEETEETDYNVARTDEEIAADLGLATEENTANKGDETSDKFHPDR